MTGIGTNALVDFKAKLSPKVTPDKTLKYNAMLKSVDKKDGLQGLSLSVRLPAIGVTYIGSASSKAYKITTEYAGLKGNKIHYQTVKGQPGAADKSLVPAIVTWDGLDMPPRKSRRFVIGVRVDEQGTDHGMPLTFHSTVYQQLPVNGLQYCRVSYNETVVVRTK